MSNPNPITGDISVTINQVLYTLRYTWAALADIEAQFSKNPLQVLPDILKIDVLKKVLVSGLKYHHEHVTEDNFNHINEPIVPLAQKIKQAIELAYFGDLEPEENATQGTDNPK